MIVPRMTPKARFYISLPLSRVRHRLPSHRAEASSQPGRARCPSAGERSGVLRDIATESNSLIMIPSPTRRMARGPWRRPGRRHWYYRLGVTVMAARARYRVPRASAGRPNGSGAPRLGQRPPRPSTSAGNLSDRRRR